jgi:hypothetical protein
MGGVMRRWLSRVRGVLVVACLTLGPSVPVVAVSARSAAAALPPVVGCGFRFGPITQSGAAGTLFFAAVLEPDSPVQRCNVAVTFTASATIAAALLVTAGPYTNIDNNPLTATETVSFVPGRRPPALGVGWGGFHCADPPGPGTLGFTAGGQEAAAEITPNSCGPPGAPHSFLEPFAVPVLSEVGIAPTLDDHGYRSVDQDGSITREGDATSFGPATTNASVVGIQTAPTGDGVWLAASDGGVFAFGSAAFHGSLGGVHLNAPVVGMAATPDGRGYWLVASDGGVFAFGDAAFDGSLGGVHLNAPVVGMAATPDGRGYWLVASDGGVFAFGDAAFHGSLGSVHLNAPVVGMAAGPHVGYWLVASDGGVFNYGGVPFEGSTGGVRLNAPISAMAATSSGAGYWLVGSDNGIFTFGDARFFGSNPITP